MSRDGLKDDDAESICHPVNKEEPISATQYLELKELLQQLPPPVEKNMLKWCQVDKLELVAKTKFDAVKNSLLKKISEEAENGNN